LSEKTRKTLVFGLLIGALIWAYFNFTGRKARRAADNRPRPAVVQPVVIPPDMGILSPATAEEYEAKSWGKDPFYHARPSAPGRIAPDKVKLRLLGILYREINAQALINGRVVAEGDTLSGFRVERIERDHVKMSDGGKTVILRVEKEQS
jgi:hypothetical protein